MNPVETHKKMVAHRERSGVVAPTLGNVRLALKGKTYKRGLAESRGRKRKLSNTNVRALDKARKSLIRIDPQSGRCYRGALASHRAEGAGAQG